MSFVIHVYVTVILTNTKVYLKAEHCKEGELVSHQRVEIRGRACGRGGGER